MKKQYDYLLVGSGLFAGVFAYYAKAGKTCLVLEKRGHAGGNIYCENIEGINVHRYGAHIFHTSNKEVWNFVNSLVEFNRYTNSPVANYKGEMYNMPFNMNTFSRMWGISTPEEAKDHQRAEKGHQGRAEEPGRAGHQPCGEPTSTRSLSRATLRNSGAETAKELPASSSSNVFRCATPMTTTTLTISIRGSRSAATIRSQKSSLRAVRSASEPTTWLTRRNMTPFADKVVYTGTIDSYFDYCFGKLQYRSLRFETEVLDCDNYQGNAVINYTDRETPYTRIIEHKHFEFGTQEKTVITREYPAEWTEGMEPYYPVNDERNQELYKKYAELAEKRRM